MAMGRVEFVNGVANVYDERGFRITQKQCDKLIGYGPKGFIVKCNWAYRIFNEFGVIVKSAISEQAFLREQFNLHDDYLQVRC